MLFSRLIIQIDNEKSNGPRIKDIILYDVKIKSILFRVKRANIDICLRNVISKHDTSDVASKTGDLFSCKIIVCTEILQVFKQLFIFFLRSIIIN